MSPRPLVHVLGAAFAGMVVLAGCWTLTGDVDDLVGGSTPGTTSGGGGGGNGTRDGGDARPGEEAGAPPPDAASPFCASRVEEGHTLCDDFDVPGQSLATSWMVDMGNGGTVGLAVTAVTSLPNALRVTLPTPCNDAYGQLKRDQVGQARVVHIAADVDIVSAPTTPTAVVLFGIWWLTATASYRLGVAYQNGRLAIHENDIGGAGFRTVAETSGVHPKNRFVRVEAGFVLSQPSPVLTVDADGVRVLSAPIVPVAPTDSTTHLEIGAYSQSNCNAPSEVFYDNITFDFVPR